MGCYARYLFFGVIAILAVGQIIVACGQKGPLYHPPAEKETAPTQQEEAVPSAPPESR